MKKLLLLTIAFLAFGYVNAQTNAQLNLTLRYNISLDRYEVFARPDVSRTFNLGSSQISIVFPASFPNVDLDAGYNLTSVNGGSWSDNSRIFAPANTPNVDYHGFGTSGSQVVFVAGQELLMFHFKIPGACLAGLRIFENGVDPASNAHPDMLGSDFGNSFGDASFIEHFKGVYDNSGSVCSVCNVKAPTLSIN